MRTILRLLLSVFGLAILAGCASTKPTTNPDAIPSIITDIKNAPIAAPVPEAPTQPVIEPPLPEPIPEPEPITEPVPEPAPEPVKIPSYESGFKNLKFWQGADPRPALFAFQKTCETWRNKKDEDWLDKGRHAYGQFKDWKSVCALAADIKQPSRGAAVHFFQMNFEPVTLGDAPQIGLLTGYYAPEVDVRLKADAVFNAPILARPTASEIQNLPRKDLGVKSSKVLAYGRPIDVFFLQVQGSGRIKFKDGTSYMAAYDGHNSHTYKSIGRVLIKRGELDKDSVSKQSIEKWMDKAGRIEAQKLMNENPRYIFFKTEYLTEGVGPKGSTGVNLTSLGSMAIDPRHMPYGSLVWLETKLPAKGGDFSGEPSGLLVVAQDTGSAIKGQYRGDLYFGIGDAAGAKAGVMKHKAVWTIFLPIPLAVKTQILATAVS